MQYPIKTMTTDILKQSAKARQPEAMKFLKNEFDNNYKAEVDKEMSKNLNKITSSD